MFGLHVYSSTGDDFGTIPLIRPQGVLNPKLKTEVRRLMVGWL